MKTQTTLILGGPGAGKTTTLLDILESELQKNVRPERIAFVSFTKKAVTEARDRIKTRFNIPERRTPYFRTLHSLCFLEIGARRDSVLGRQHWREIGQLLGVRITGYIEADEEIAAIGDRMLFLDNLARTTKRSLNDVWHDANVDVAWVQLEQFVATVQKYKYERGLIDFTDMLTEFVRASAPLPVDVAIIDEAQDLSPLQWDVVRKAFANCKRIYFAGDDDQAIYAWSGADVEQFLSLKFDEKIVLAKSHRLPSRNFEYATRVVNQIKNRYAKEWTSRGTGGEVSSCFNPSQLNLADGSWLLLARNACFLRHYEAECIAQGVVYTYRRRLSVDPNDITAIRAYEGPIKKGEEVDSSTRSLLIKALNLKDNDAIKYNGIWHDVFKGFSAEKIAYYLNILRSGRRLSAEPIVHIDTIHSVKGGEAVSVAVVTDLTTATDRNLMQKPDDEYRVFYVGVTRAIERLYILTGQTSRVMPLPLPA